MKQSDEDSNYSDSDYAIQMKINCKEDDESTDANNNTDNLNKASREGSGRKRRISKNKSTNLFCTDHEKPMFRNSSFQQERRATIFDCLNDDYIENDSLANLINFGVPPNNQGYGCIPDRPNSHGHMGKCLYFLVSLI